MRTAMAQAPRLYLVLYDVAKPKRWRKVYRLLQAAGAWAQLSAFFCRLTPAAQVGLSRQLAGVIDATADRLLIVDLGPADSAVARIATIGDLSLPEVPMLRIL